MKTYTRFLPQVLALMVSVIILLLTIPFVSVAQVIPETGVGGVVSCSGSHCNFCDLLTTGSNVLNWLFGMVFIVFGVLVFISGFKMVAGGMSGNYSSLNDTKKSLTNAIIGIIIIFSAWLIVDTLMKAIANNGELTGFGMWNSIEDVNCGSQVTPNASAPLADQTGGGGIRVGGGPLPGEFCVDTGGERFCTQNPDLVSIRGNDVCVTVGGFTHCQPNNGLVTICEPNTVTAESTCTYVSDSRVEGAECQWRAPSNDYVCTEVVPTNPGPSTVEPGDRVASSQVLQTLSSPSVNIGVSSTGGCYDSNRSNCTGLDFNQQTIDSILNFRNGCGVSCEIVITGGTEIGHSGTGPGTHAGGDKFDLRTTDSVNSYITGPSFVQQNFVSPYNGRVRNGYVNQQSGVFCVNEGDHWDCLRI